MASRKLFILLLLLVTLSLACSLVGDETPASREEQEEETPVPSETPTITEEPTPTFTLTPTTTATATTTSTPTNTPTATNSPTPTEDLLVPRPPQSDNPCANVFYPLVEDYQFIYEVIYRDEEGTRQTDQLGITVSKVENSEAVLDMLNMTTGIMTQSTVTCDDGALVDFPVIMLNFLVGEVDGNLQLDHIDGIFVPSYETFYDQNWETEWISQYLANGQIQVDVEGETTTATLTDSVVTMNWEIEGEDEMFEIVALPTSVYQDAIKVIRTTSFDIKLSLADSGFGIAVDATLTLDMLLYYEPNLGLLKQEVSSADVTIFGATYPIAIEGSMVLKEFRDGE